MLISRRILLVFLVLISCSIHTMAQTKYFYYNKGGKIPLTLNENKVVVHVSKENQEVSERVQENVQVLGKIQNESIDKYIISRSDYEKLTSLDTWEEYSKSVMLTRSYYTERNVEVFETGNISVKIKKEEDFELLTSYIERYKLQITFHRPSMPLWYGLSITLDSGIGPLELANKLWETGDFASSEPDLAAENYLDQTTVEEISTPPTENSPAIFNLQGRRLSGKPAKGVYIENGRKRVKK